MLRKIKRNSMSRWPFLVAKSLVIHGDPKKSTSGFAPHGVILRHGCPNIIRLISASGERHKCWKCFISGSHTVCVNSFKWGSFFSNWLGHLSQVSDCAVICAGGGQIIHQPLLLWFLGTWCYRMALMTMSHCSWLWINQKMCVCVFAVYWEAVIQIPRTIYIQWGWPPSRKDINSLSTAPQGQVGLLGGHLQWWLPSNQAQNPNTTTKQIQTTVKLYICWMTFITSDWSSAYICVHMCYVYRFIVWKCLKSTT